MKFQDREVIVFAGDSVTDADKYNTCLLYTSDAADEL